MAIFHIIYKGTMTSQDAILQKLPTAFFGQVEEDLHKICLWEDIQEEFSCWIRKLFVQLKTQTNIQERAEEAVLWKQVEDAFLHQRMQEACSYRLEEQGGSIHVLSFSDAKWDRNLELYVVLQDHVGTCFITGKQESIRLAGDFVKKFTLDKATQELEILQKMMQQMLELPWSDAYFEGLSMQKEYEKMLPYLMLFVLKAPIFKVHGEHMASMLH